MTYVSPAALWLHRPAPRDGAAAGSGSKGGLRSRCRCRWRQVAGQARGQQEEPCEEQRQPNQQERRGRCQHNVTQVRAGEAKQDRMGCVPWGLGGRSWRAGGAQAAAHSVPTPVRVALTSAEARDGATNIVACHGDGRAKSSTRAHGHGIRGRAHFESTEVFLNPALGSPWQKIMLFYGDETASRSALVRFVAASGHKQVTWQPTRFQSTFA